MGAFKSAVITKKGQALLTKVMHGSAKLDFTQIKTSEKPLSGDLASLTSIGTVKQAEKVSSVVKQNDYNVKVSTSFSNNGLTAGYYIRNIGLYAMDPTEGEILYSISVADESTATADWMPPFNSNSVSSLMVDLITAVSNASSVNVVVDPTATATVAQIIEVNKRLTALSNAITTATEKTLNGSVAGGLKITKVWGKSEQNITTGKNLLQNVAESQTINGVTFTVNEDGSVIANGTATAQAVLHLNENSLDHLQNGEYVPSGITGVRITYSDGTNEYLNKPFTVDDTVTSIAPFLAVEAGVTVSNHVFKPMFRLASITDGTYEKFSGGKPSPNIDYPQEIRSVEVSEIKACGKNLLDLRDATIYENTGGITSEVLGDGGIKISGTATTYAMSVHKKINLRRGEYVLSHNGSKNALARLRVKKGDGTSVDYVRDDPFSVDGTEVSILFMVQADKDWTVDETIYPMLRYANITNNTYEPYKENSITLSQPITLRGIGDVLDELTLDGVVRKVNKVVLDKFKTGVGNVGYSPVLNTTDCFAFYAGKWKQPPSVDHYTYTVCDKLPYVHDIVGTNNQGCWWSKLSDGGQLVLRLPKGSIGVADLDVFEAWLADNPLTIIYPIDSPVVEPLPIADQIALRSLLSIDGVTCLSTDSEIDPVIEVEYGTNKAGSYTLTGLLTAQRNELKLAELTSAVLTLNQE